MQALSLEAIADSNQLIVSCVMAHGAESNHCTVEMRNETGIVQGNYIVTDGPSALCTLTGLPPGKYMVWAYDEGYIESPAVNDVYNITSEFNEVSTSS